MRLAAIVPSLNPDERFCEVVTGLIEIGFGCVYIVDDGSGPEYEHIFAGALLRPEVVLVRHEVNCGKGRALKSAMKLYLEQCEGEYIGVVTVDGDGQHSPQDSLSVGKRLIENPEALVLGVRDFDDKSVPARSAFGNKFTRNIMWALSGVKVSDTQTGLRAISNDFARELLDVQGERYEFETNMLLQASKLRIPILEEPIGTIYIDDNSASHYRPLVDSARIMALILKFVLSSILSAGVDYLAFCIFEYLFAYLPAGGRLFVTIAAARIISALFNFVINKKIVFQSKEQTSRAMLRYGILALAMFLCSYGGTYLLSEILPLPAPLAKPLVDTILFLISFKIQRRWIF